MNGVHDMGGMHGMGPIIEEKNEPVFHNEWEARIFAMTRAVGAWRKWNVDAVRHSNELIPPAEYLRMNYYERWMAALVKLMVQSGLTTRAEIESGVPAAGSVKAVPALSADKAVAFVAKGLPASRNVNVVARFQVGQRVRARNMHPLGHTRLPRYARGKFGTVDRDHGVFVFPDTNAHFLGENPQHVYSVRFAARELWGAPAGEKDSVYVDMWDDYLEPA
jgi:nitrile hydratase subunit beta